jgi:hypothetical protein
MEANVINLQDLRNVTQSFSQIIRCPIEDLNQSLPEYKSEKVLLLQVARFGSRKFVYQVIIWLVYVKIWTAASPDAHRAIYNG